MQVRISLSKREIEKYIYHGLVEGDVIPDCAPEDIKLDTQVTTDDRTGNQTFTYSVSFERKVD